MFMNTKHANHWVEPIYCIHSSVRITLGNYREYSRKYYFKLIFYFFEQKASYAAVFKEFCYGLVFYFFKRY